MNKEELQTVLKSHKKWLYDEDGGKRADLRDADLRCADLRCADLRCADLHGADLRCAKLSGADLRDADLRCADLHGAKLSGADLHGSDLHGADLHGADLHGADLRDADLRCADLHGAKLSGADLRCAKLSGADLRCADLHGSDLSDANLHDVQKAQLSIVPEAGSFVGWKKCRDGCIVKLLIPSDAKRSNATGRKCRCSKAWTLEIDDSSGMSLARVESYRGGVYEVGKLTVPDAFDDDRWAECSNGIHFFITRAEAEAY